MSTTSPSATSTRSQSFRAFTNKFSVTKTLRFELVPHEATRKYINFDAASAREIFPEEQARQEARPHIKKYWDIAIVDFITRALQEVQLSVEDISSVIEQERKILNAENATQRSRTISEMWQLLARIRKELADDVKTFTYEYNGEEVSQKKLLSKDFYKILERKYENDQEALRHLNAFSGMFTQLYDLLGNRGHYFGDEGKHGQVATRVIDDNLRIFAKNALLYERTLDGKVELTDDEREIFKPEFYNKVLTQEGIDTYNTIIGGGAAEVGDVRAEGINNKINAYNQTHAQRLPLVQTLYNQIGTERDVRYETIESDEELYAMLSEVKPRITELYDTAREFFSTFFDTIDQYDISKIYISKQSLRAVAQAVLSEWAALNDVLKKKERFTTLQAVKEYIEQYGDAFRLADGRTTTWNEFLARWRDNIEQVLRPLEDVRMLADGFDNAVQKVREGSLDDEARAALRTYLEWAVDVSRLARTFRVRDKKGSKHFDVLKELSAEEKDQDFYARWEQFAYLIEDIRVQKIFNKTRNYLTKELATEEEVRVYFSPQFLGGWSESQLANKKSVILRHEDDIYLGVLRNNFSFEKMYTDSESAWQKMVLKTLDFKTLVGKGFLNHYGAKFSDMNDAEGVAKGIEFLTNVRPQYLDDYPSLRSVVVKAFETKRAFREACIAALQQEKGFYFANVNEEALMKHVKSGNLYLFKICNKDLCGKGHGKRNVHTIIWQTLFSDENIKQTPQPYMLLADGKIFFRDISCENQKRKMLSNGAQEVSRDNAPVYDAHRYTQRKLIFHIPVQINAHKGATDDKTFTTHVNEALLQEPCAILGIDRGEKHLLYWSLIDKDGNHIDSGSLNTIHGTDYHALLEKRERERLEARKTWRSVGNITKLKEGYLSHVIHFIVSKALEYDAIIVLENLAFRFIQKRGGQFEKSVYQQFQKALLQKLELIIDKDQQYAFDAAQLVCTKEKRGTLSLKDLQGQHGITFFLDPAYTSQTCPTCGWRKDVYIKYKNIDQVISDLNKHFKSIVYDTNRNAFVLTYTREFDGSEVTITSRVDRLVWDSVKRSTLSLTADDFAKAFEAIFGNGATESQLIGFSSAFEGFELEFSSGDNLLPELLKKDERTYATAWKAFVYFLNRVLQIRNHYRAGEEQEADFVQCPLCGFDTRKEDAFIKNGDDLGAYNIARKGYIALQEVRTSSEKPDLKIDKHRWDEYLYKINSNKK